MRAVVQRVACAVVEVDGRADSAIGRGFVVLLGVARGDGEREAEALAAKVARLRIFADERKPMNLDVRAARGEALVVSQVTLVADVSGGNRPSLVPAAAPAEAERLYLHFARRLEHEGIPTRTGVFGATMQVALVNDGPVTIVLDVLP